MMSAEFLSKASMEVAVFMSVLVAGIALVSLQGLLSWLDGYLTKGQMRARGVTTGWSFFEHGGMWADVFLISPMLAYLLVMYRIPYASKWGLLTLACAAALAFVMGSVYHRNGLKMPESHTHDGRTTPAGWVHGAFAIFAFSTFALFYLRQTSPLPSVRDVLAISILLVPFTFLGLAKFNRSWRLSSQDRWQIAAEIAGLAVLAAVHLWLA
jgi:hypothetical protein